MSACRGRSDPLGDGVDGVDGVSDGGTGTPNCRAVLLLSRRMHPRCRILLHSGIVEEMC